MQNQICPVNFSHKVEQKNSGFTHHNYYFQCTVCKEDISYLAKTNSQGNSSLDLNLLAAGASESFNFKKCFNLISLKHNKQLGFDTVPKEDKIVLKNFKNLNIESIYKFDENPYTRTILAKIKSVDSIFDLALVLTLARPVMVNLSYDKEYIKRLGGTPYSCHHALLDPTLKPTCGLFLFKDQVVETLRTMGNFSDVEAINTTRAIGGRKQGVPFSLKDKFIQNATNKGMNGLIARSLWFELEKTAAYTTEKSHSIAYAHFAYTSMWLKTYYPNEWKKAIS